MQKIFLSYPYGQPIIESLASMIAEIVQSQDMACILGKQAYAGEDLGEYIGKQIDGCDGLITILSPSERNNGISNWIKGEILHAQENGKEVLCITLGELPVPIELKSFKRINLGEPTQLQCEGIKDLTKALMDWRKQTSEPVHVPGVWNILGDINPVGVVKDKKGINSGPSESVFLRWDTLGAGIRHLYRTLSADRPKVDALVGINEVGLACASYLSGLFEGKPVGYAMHHRTRAMFPRIRDRYYPLIDKYPEIPEILLVDSELKSGSSLKHVLDEINAVRSTPANFTLAVIAAQRTEPPNISLTATKMLDDNNIKTYIAYTFSKSVKFTHRCLNHIVGDQMTVLEHIHRTR